MIPQAAGSFGMVFNLSSRSKCIDDKLVKNHRYFSQYPLTIKLSIVNNKPEYLKMNEENY